MTESHNTGISRGSGVTWYWGIHTEQRYPYLSTRSVILKTTTVSQNSSPVLSVPPIGTWNLRNGVRTGISRY